MKWASKTSSRACKHGLTSTEIVLLICTALLLSTVLFYKFSTRKVDSQVSLAAMNVQTLFQNEVVQYFSSHQFVYSLTRAKSSTDFFQIKPPSGKAEQLLGYPGDIYGSNMPEYVNWQKIGFPLNQPSFFIYRLEPEPFYHEQSKPPPDDIYSYNHFHAMAIADLKGDGNFAVISRGGFLDNKNYFQSQPDAMSIELEQW
jgi:hypothetical protein